MLLCWLHDIELSVHAATCHGSKLCKHTASMKELQHAACAVCLSLATVQV
jgi:hypothetical protein